MLASRADVDRAVLILGVPLTALSENERRYQPYYYCCCTIIIDVCSHYVSCDLV